MTTYLNAKDVPHYLRGSYSGNKFSFATSLEGFIPSDAGIWGGGSRDTYQLIELATGRSVPISDSTAPWSDSRTDKRFPMRPGFAIVCHSISCGKDVGLSFTLHPDDATKMLPAPGAALTPFEQLVLNATRSYKSSYNGQDRYEMARPNFGMDRYTKDDIAKKLAINADLIAKHGGDVKRKDGKTLNERVTELEAITELYPTRSEWEAAKQSLIARKYLTKAGAITPDGRNASQSLNHSL